MSVRWFRATAPSRRRLLAVNIRLTVELISISWYVPTSFPVEFPCLRWLRLALLSCSSLLLSRTTLTEMTLPAWMQVYLYAIRASAKGSGRCSWLAGEDDGVHIDNSGFGSGGSAESQCRLLLVECNDVTVLRRAGRII